MKILTSLEIKWGILFFMFSLIWMLFEKLMGWHDAHIDQHANMTLLFSIPALAIYIFAMLEKRKQLHQTVFTWKQGFVCGLMVTLVVTILSPLAQFITFKFITPDYFKNVTDYSVEVLGRDRASMEENFNLKSYMLQSVIGAVIMGVVTSATVALFVRRTPAFKWNKNDSTEIN